MPRNTLTAEDIRHLDAALARRLADPEDDGGPEDVMTSIGYVGLWRDGEIVSFGQVIHVLDGGE